MATMETDAKAFYALMEHIGQTDGTVGTVIGIQVENETGNGVVVAVQMSEEEYYLICRCLYQPFDASGRRPCPGVLW